MDRATPNQPPAPAKRPCASCPYRCDVPSGVWDASEYAKLVDYDEPSTWAQPAAVFMCHQRDQRLCAGWVAVHDMAESLSVRIAASTGLLDEQVLAIVHQYSTDVPLFASGAQAAEHGMREIERPSHRAGETIRKIIRKKELSS